MSLSGHLFSLCRWWYYPGDAQVTIILMVLKIPGPPSSVIILSWNFFFFSNLLRLIEFPPTVPPELKCIILYPLWPLAALKKLCNLNMKSLGLSKGQCYTLPPSPRGSFLYTWIINHRAHYMSREFKQTTRNRETMLEVSSTFNSKKLLDSNKFGREQCHEKRHILK